MTPKYNPENSRKETRSIQGPWQGPYISNRRVGPVDYEIKTPDKRAELKIYHVNLLKKRKDREALAQVAEELGPCKGDTLKPTGEIPQGENLSST